MKNDAAAITMTVLALVALILRLMAKFVQRTDLKMDDWVIILAFVWLSLTRKPKQKQKKKNP